MKELSEAALNTSIPQRCRTMRQVPIRTANGACLIAGLSVGQTTISQRSSKAARCRGSADKIHRATSIRSSIHLVSTGALRAGSGSSTDREAGRVSSPAGPASGHVRFGLSMPRRQAARCPRARAWSATLWFGLHRTATPGSATFATGISASSSSFAVDCMLGPLYDAARATQTHRPRQPTATRRPSRPDP